MKISVITPCFNCGDYLQGTIESVVEQTYPVFEHIIVNDGSTDNSLGIAERYIQHVTIVSKPNGGISSARNLGLDRIRGDYVLFLDSDDLLYPNALENMAHAALEAPGSIITMGVNYFIDTPQNIVRTNMAAVDELLPTILIQNFLPPHCWLVPRGIANQVGHFDTDLRYLEDWDYWVRASLLGANLKNCDFVGGLYRVHAASVTRTANMKIWYICQAKIIHKAVQHALLSHRFSQVYGDTLFWSAATAIRACRKNGNSWGALEMNMLASAMDGLLDKFEPSSKHARFAKRLGMLNTCRLDYLFQKILN